MVEKGLKKGLKLGGLNPKLTKAERDVLHFLTDEFLTIKQIAIRRRTSIQAVYKIASSLKKKGLINKGLKKVENFQPTFQPFQPKIRLHGQEFNVKLLYKDYKYREILKKSNTIITDGNTIRLYKNSIEVYSGQSFFADTTQKATVRSFKYWNRFFSRLEHDLKVILVKPRSQNIKLVNQHYAETNNEFAEECEKKADKIRVYTNEDGKLWFTIDNSFNLHEAETLHPQTAKHDMSDAIRPFFNDLRDNKPPTLSDIMKIMAETTEINKDTASGLNSVVTYIKSQLPPQDNGINKKERPFYTG